MAKGETNPVRGDCILTKGDFILATGEAIPVRGDFIFMRGDSILVTGEAKPVREIFEQRSQKIFVFFKIHDKNQYF